MTRRVGILTERLLTGFGVDLVVDETSKRLVKNGYEVTVYTTRCDDAFFNRDYSVVNLRKEINSDAHMASLGFMRDSIQFLSDQPVDVWLIHTPPFYYWHQHLRSPVIMVEHGTPPGKYFGKRFGRFLDSDTKRRFNRLYRSTRSGDGLAAISDYIRSFYPRDIRKNVLLLQNGADHYPRATEEEAIEFRKRIKVRRESIMVLWVGRIQPESDKQPYKGLGELLEVVPIIKKECKKIRVVAVGRAKESACKILESQGIIPVLNLSSDEMPAAYAAADIYISTSRWEGFNLPLVEAQFQGTPVIAYNLCAHPEVVKDGHSGILAGNTRTFCEKVLEIAQDKDKRKYLAEGARKFSSHFTWDKNVEALIKLIEGCLNQTARTADHPAKPAFLKKNLSYYWQTSQYLIRSEGWKVFFQETKGSLTRRYGSKK